MLSIADIFVGSVALVLGISALAVALLNWEAAFQLPKAQAIENRFGRRGGESFLRCWDCSCWDWAALRSSASPPTPTAEPATTARSPCSAANCRIDRERRLLTP